MSNHRKAFLEITNRCNLNCAFCPGTKRDYGMLDEQQFSFLANRLSLWAEFLYYHLMGEPTSHPLLPSFIQIASSLNLKSIITTNGTLLPKCADALIAAKPHKVSISLHAFEANPPGISFEEYINGCVLFAVKAARENIITVFRLWNLDGLSKGAMNKKNMLILDLLHDAFPQEWKSIRSGHKLCEHVFLGWGEKFDWPELNHGVMNENGFCYALRDQVGVLCDGTVVPCCLDRDGTINLGNLFVTPLEEILSSPRSRALYDGFTHHRCQEQLCKRCMRAGYYR